MKKDSTRPRVSTVAPDSPNFPQHDGAILLRNIPGSTHRAFKSACGKRGITMRDALIVMMRRYSSAVEKGDLSIRIDKM